jgi:hypothetical protein
MLNEEEWGEYLKLTQLKCPIETFCENFTTLNFVIQRLRNQELAEVVIDWLLNEILEYNSVVYNRLYFHSSYDLQWAYLQKLHETILPQCPNLPHQNDTTHLTKSTIFSIKTDWKTPKSIVGSVLHRILDMLCEEDPFDPLLLEDYQFSAISLVESFYSLITTITYILILILILIITIIIVHIN